MPFLCVLGWQRQSRLKCSAPSKLFNIINRHFNISLWRLLFRFLICCLTKVLASAPKHRTSVNRVDIHTNCLLRNLFTNSYSVVWRIDVFFILVLLKYNLNLEIEITSRFKVDIKFEFVACEESKFTTCLTYSTCTVQHFFDELFTWCYIVKLSNLSHDNAMMLNIDTHENPMQPIAADNMSPSIDG